MRNRNGWILGDIVYSTPVVVGAPSIGSVPPEATGDCSCDCLNDEACQKQCFYCYRYKNLYRKKVVYVGANDGSLHAFLLGEWDEDNNKWVYEAGQDPDNDNHKIGDELWAYVPSNLLSRMKELAKPSYGTDGGCQHCYMVDLSPEAWDVYIRVDTDNDGSLDDETPQWRTVLIGGERGGGDVYFAIDVTDPTDPKVLWEYSVIRNMLVYISNQYQFPFSYDEYMKLKNVPFSWSVPYVGKLQFPMSATYAYYLRLPLDPNPPSGYG